jgi:hypothetical protein
VLAVAVVAGMVTALVGASPGMASAVAHRPAQARLARGSGLSQAPAGLRAAVHRTLGLPPLSGAANAWSQQAKLTSSGGASGDHFGWTVAIAGSTAVVGAYANNSLAGAAYVFTRSGTKWSQKAKLTASDATAGDQFGYAVALSGTTAVIGAPGKGTNTGAAYVFTGSGSTWTQQAELTAGSAAAQFDYFGGTVAISGTTAVVGADEGGNGGNGAAYVFVRSGTTWTQQTVLTASDGASGVLFGFSVAISGTTAVVGAWGNNSDTGAAYVFVRSGTTWTQQAELTATGGATNDDFGTSVAIAKSIAVVGASQSGNGGNGAAYVFTRSGTTWSQQAKLTAADGAAGDLFGDSVAISGTTALVGAPSSNSATGAAYTFARSGTAWSQQAKLIAGDGASGDNLGRSVAIAGTTAMAGADGSDTATGAAYAFADAFPSKGGMLFGGTDGLGNDLTAIGRNLAIYRVYYKIGGTFPSFLDNEHMSQGSTMLVSLDSNGDTYTQIANGKDDASITSFLEAVNQAAITNNLSSIYISFQHEPDNSTHASLGTAAQFVQAWDHVHQLATSNKLDWNQNAGGRLLWAVILLHHTWALGTNAGGYWPGPGEADIVATDGYNSFGCGTNPDSTPSEIFSPLLSFASANGGLPVIIAEYAAISSMPAHQAAFIGQMQTYLVANDKTIKVAMYWDDGGSSCDYHVDNNPGSLAALKTLGALAAMQGTAHL